MNERNADAELSPIIDGDTLKRFLSHLDVRVTELCKMLWPEVDSEKATKEGKNQPLNTKQKSVGTALRAGKNRVSSDIRKALLANREFKEWLAKEGRAGRNGKKDGSGGLAISADDFPAKQQAFVSQGGTYPYDIFMVNGCWIPMTTNENLVETWHDNTRAKVVYIVLWDLDEHAAEDSTALDQMTTNITKHVLEEDHAKDADAPMKIAFLAHYTHLAASHDDDSWTEATKTLREAFSAPDSSKNEAACALAKMALALKHRHPGLQMYLDLAEKHSSSAFRWHLPFHRFAPVMDALRDKERETHRSTPTRVMVDLQFERAGTVVYLPKKGKVDRPMLVLEPFGVLKDFDGVQQPAHVICSYEAGRHAARDVAAFMMWNSAWSERHADVVRGTKLSVLHKSDWEHLGKLFLSNNQLL